MKKREKPKNLNLAELRKETGLTQGDFAKALGITQTRVSRIEANGNIPNDLLIPWARTTGRPIEDLLPNYQPVQEIVFDFDRSLYGPLTEDLNLLLQYIARFSSSGNSRDVSISPTVEEFRDSVIALKEKPWVVLTGHFDAGKSHLCNFYLGEDRLPTGYRPVTRYPTFVRHISDRPQWFKEDLWLMGSEFNPEKWGDQDHCTENRILAGSWDTLEQHATLKGRKDNSEEGAVLAFVDAPLLYSCVLVDLPGYDDAMTNASIIDQLGRRAVILLYLCPATGFLDGRDFARLGHLLRALPRYEKNEDFLEDFPTLGNLFIIATHVHQGITKNELEDEILKGGSKAFYDHFESNLLRKLSRDGQSISPEDIEARFFSFYQEIPLRRKRLEDDLKLLLGEYMPSVKKQSVEETILTFKEEGSANYAEEIDRYKQIVDDTKEARRLYGRLEKEEPERKKRHDRKVKRIEREIIEFGNQDLEKFRAVFEEETKVTKIEKMIKKRYKGDKKKAEKQASAYVLEEIQSKTDSFRSNLVDKTSKLIEGFVEDYNKQIGKLGGIEKFSTPFDTRRTFLGGLAGLSTLGALGAWAATLGNLGGYILVAKGVSALSTIGISFAGGTAGAVALVSALGGPITLALGVAVAVGAFFSWLFGESWERRLAKKIKEVYKKEDVLSKNEGIINNFWRETQTAFKKGANGLDKQHKNHIKDLKVAFGGSQEDLEALEKKLESYEEIKSFFVAIPWR